jgi:hypothetical protein
VVDTGSASVSAVDTGVSGGGGVGVGVAVGATAHGVYVTRFDG